MSSVKKILHICTILSVFLACPGYIYPGLSPKLFQGRYKISQNIQNFIENFNPVSDKNKIVALLSATIDNFSDKEQRNFFVHILNTTMVTTMKTAKEVEQFIERTKEMVTVDHKLPHTKKSVLDSITELFKEKSIEELFDQALTGNKEALEKIKEKAASLKNLSEDQKHVILKKLEDAALAMLKKVDEKIPQTHQALEEKYEAMQKAAKSNFEKLSQNLDATSQAYKNAQKAYSKELDDIMDEQKTEITKNRILQDSDNYLVLKYCRDIVYALEPMLSTQHQHIMFTYDRTNNNALLNLLNFKDFDLSNIKTKEELDSMIQKQVAQLVADKKIDLPIHRETKAKFNSLVKDEILEHHPDLVNSAKQTAQTIDFVNKEHNLKYKQDLLDQHNKLMRLKPRWQEEQIYSNLNRYLLEREQDFHPVHSIEAHVTK